ncbi:MAG: ABC transporter, partial [Candidatus Verstraetearchaeota archaeon]|nr:ABC transporter [Candidatus Verstraetearchaeota archaeon]
MKSSSPWSLYSQLRGALAFAWLNGVIAAVRNPLWIAAYLTPPLTLLILFNILVAGEMKGYALAGGFVIILATNGLWLTGDAAYYRLYLK